MDGTENSQGVNTSEETTETSVLVKAAELKGRSDGLADVKRTLAEAKKYSTAAEAAEIRVKRHRSLYTHTGVHWLHDKFSAYLPSSHLADQT